MESAGQVQFQLHLLHTNTLEKQMNVCILFPADWLNNKTAPKKAINVGKDQFNSNSVQNYYTKLVGQTGIFSIWRVTKIEKLATLNSIELRTQQQF